MMRLLLLVRSPPFQSDRNWVQFRLYDDHHEHQAQVHVSVSAMTVRDVNVTSWAMGAQIPSAIGVEFVFLSTFEFVICEYDDIDEHLLHKIMKKF